MVSEENENENLCDKSVKNSHFRKMENNENGNELDNTKDENKNIREKEIQRNLIRIETTKKYTKNKNKFFSAEVEIKKKILIGLPFSPFISRKFEFV